MFEYSICNIFDREIFVKQCLAIEKHIPNLTKSELLDDVDGSQIQIYAIPDGDIIRVENDIDFGVCVKSDIDIIKYFN